MRTVLAPNRIAIYLTVLASIFTAIAPMVAELDTTSVVSLVTGLAGIVIVVFKFLTGWQSFEAREADNGSLLKEIGELPPETPTDVPR